MVVCFVLCSFIDFIEFYFAFCIFINNIQYAMLYEALCLCLRLLYFVRTVKLTVRS